MANVYTASFISQSIIGPGSALFEFPDGFVSVVRCITAVLHSDPSVTNPCVCNVNVNGTTYWALRGPGECDTNYEWEGRAAFPATAVLEVSVLLINTSANINITGYLLTLP